MTELNLKSHRQFVQEQIQADPEFAGLLEETRREVAFAIELARLRERRKMTQQALAEATGIKQPMLARYERGQIPTVPTLQRLAQAMDAEVRITGSAIRFVPNRKTRVRST